MWSLHNIAPLYNHHVWRDFGHAVFGGIFGKSFLSASVMLAVNKQILHALRGLRGHISQKCPHASTFRKSKLEPILMRDILSAKAAGKDHLRYTNEKLWLGPTFTLWRNAKQHIYLLHDASSYKFDWLSTQSPSHLNKIMHICDTFIDSLSYFASEAVIWRTI